MSLEFLKTALQNKNVQAFMSVISRSEGTNYPDGYLFLFDSTENNKIRFTDFSHHPDIKEPFRGGFSSAAGKWQILYDTWEVIQQKYHLPDFSPSSQDIACVELISECNVLQHLMDGDFETVVKGTSHIWASLPFAPYNQPVHSMDVVTNWYKDAGGNVV